MSKSDNAHLITQLCWFIAKRLTEIWQKESEFDNESLKLGYFWHGAASTWEDACDTMWKLGLAYAGDPATDEWEVTYNKYIEGEEKYYNIFSSVHPSEVKGKIDFTYFNLELGLPYTPEVGMKDVLKSFTELAADWDGPMLKYRGEAFRVSDYELQPLMKSLIANGFLECCDEGCFWTDKIAPTMLGLYEWSENDVETEWVDWDKIKN